ncbi:unnamed protein product, partial [Tilletia controversa]
MDLDDDMASLVEEGLAMQEEDEAFTQEISKDNDHRRHNGGSDDAFPFQSKEIFLALSLKNSPQHVLSEASLGFALDFANALDARGTPSAYACSQAMKLIRSDVSPPLYRHTTSDNKIFFSSSVEDKIRNDFANPITRTKMILLPVRDQSMREVFHGNEMAHQTDTRKTPPCFRLSNGETVFTDEVVQVTGGQLLRPYTFFINEEGDPRCEAWQVIRRGDHFEAYIQGVSPVEFDPETIETWERSVLHEVDVFDQHGTNLPRINHLRLKAGNRLVYQVPVILFEDETSGSTTKRWNEHIGIYMSNAALPRAEMDKRINVKLLSVSTKVSGHDLMSAAVDELIALHNDPFPVHDCFLNEEALVRPILIFCVADNPMAAMLSASIGMSGLHACRCCRAGGTRRQMKEVLGFANFLKLGTKKNSVDVIKENRKQINLAAKGVASTLSNRQRDTGIKDGVTAVLCDELLALSKSKPDRHHDEAVKARRKEMLEGKWHSPLLRLYDETGFDVCAATPVDLLHTFLLGVAKYLWIHTVSSIGGTKFSSTQRDAVARLQAVSLSGVVNAKCLPGKWLIDNAGGLIGKDLKKIVQVAAVAFYPLMKAETMSLELWMAWSALGV